MKAPETLYLELTNRCNSLCATCVRTFDLAEPEGDFGIDGVRALLASFAQSDTLPRRVVLNGVGEALLHRDLVDIVALFHASGATVLFNTNAVTLTSETTLALARAGLSELRVSIDGAERATYAVMRGIDVFDRVVKNTTASLEILRVHRLETPRISIWFTGTRQNVTELPAMVRLAHTIGASEVYFQRLVFRDGDSGFGAAQARYSLLRGDLERAQERAFEEARVLASQLGVRLVGAGNSRDARDALPSARGSARPWSACARPRSSTYVTANGNVLPCCVAPFSTVDYASITLGNLAQESLPQVWTGARYADFRRRFESDDPPDCCRRCGLDWSL